MTAASSSDALAGLRGYHFPEPVSWWPPAPGWWALAGLLILLVAFLSWALVRRRRRRAALRAALTELDTLIGTRADVEPVEFTRHLSRLLRRYALVRFPRHQVAGLAGDDWLRFLDAHGGGTQAFSRGPGSLLRDAPYRPVADASVLDELTALVRTWILRNAEAAAQ
jgi:hypothetical protein